MDRRCASSLSLVVLLCGCATIGSGEIRSGQIDYNRSVVETLDVQLLLNLVRLRYRDTPYFIEIASITTQQSVAGTASLAADLAVPDPFTATPGRTLVKPGLSGTMAFTPTVVYQPLQGEAFVRRLVAPVPLVSAVVLSQSGWSISRVLRLTVDRINSVRNAPSAAGPTPAAPPDYLSFRKLAAALRSLQVSDQVAFSPLTGGGQQETFLLLLDKEARASEAVAQIRALLKLSPEIDRVPLAHDFTLPEGDRITLRMRSVLSAMFYLSQAVEVPAEDEAAGLVTVTRTPDGARFDWREVLGDLFRVRCSGAEPAGAFVKARHRGRWFWIDDADLESKSTFLLLVQLFSMQASHTTPLMPMLTLPIGH